MKIIYSAIALLALLTTSCDKEEGVATENNDTIKITTRTDEGYALTTYEGTTLSLSLFYDIDDPDNKTNTKWTYSAQSEWSTSQPSLWKNNAEGVTITAYAPYVEGVDNLDEIPFTVSTDQTQGTTSSDFVTYRKEGYNPETDGYTIDISFEHQLSTLTVYLTYGDEFGGTPTVEGVKVNALTSVLYNFSDNELSQIADLNPIDAYEKAQNTAYSVVIPPQTIELGEEMIVITIDGVEYIFNSAAKYTLAQGTAYYITLRVGQDVAPVGSVVVGDWLEGGTLDGGEAVAKDLGISLNVDGVYEISSALGFRSFASLVNEGDADIDGVLMCDIDLEDEEWSPIGSLSNPYSGVFDGAGHKVLGLSINSSEAAVGLFAYAESAEIKNLGIEGSVVGSSSLAPTVGGIVGSAVSCSIIACYNRASVETNSSDSSIVGGIVGYDPSSEGVVACYNVGVISGGNSIFIGGIIGFTMSDCTTACYYTQGSDGDYGTMLSSISALNNCIEAMNEAITTGYEYTRISDEVSPELVKKSE